MYSLSYSVSVVGFDLLLVPLLLNAILSKTWVMLIGVWWMINYLGTSELDFVSSSKTAGPGVSYIVLCPVSDPSRFGHGPDFRSRTSARRFFPLIYHTLPPSPIATVGIQ